MSDSTSGDDSSNDAEFVPNNENDPSESDIEEPDSPEPNTNASMEFTQTPKLRISGLSQAQDRSFDYDNNLGNFTQTPSLHIAGASQLVDDTKFEQSANASVLNSSTGYERDSGESPKGNLRASQSSGDETGSFEQESNDESDANRDDAAAYASQPVTERDVFGSESDAESDSDDAPNVSKRADVADIFGDDVSVSSEDAHDDAEETADSPKSQEAEETVTEALEDTARLEGDDEVAADLITEERRMDAEVPWLDCNLGRQLFFVKLPNFLSVETRPFDPSTYEDEFEDDEVLDEEGRARLKLKVENTVRWRNALDEDGHPLTDEHGFPIRQSNARVVRWSDGTMSLHLGDEIFDMFPMQLTGDDSHLFVRQGNGLIGQAVFKQKLTFRPHSTDSVTHKKMTMSMVDRVSKVQSVKVIPTPGFDPEQKRLKMAKEEEEKLRANQRRQSQRRRTRERAAGCGVSSAFLDSDLSSDGDLSSGNDAADTEGNSISLGRLKRKFNEARRRGGTPSASAVYSDSDDDKAPSDAHQNESSSDSDTAVGKARRGKKAVVVNDDDEDE